MVGAFRALRLVIHRHLFTQVNRKKTSGGLLRNLYTEATASVILGTRSASSSFDEPDPIFLSKQDNWLLENHAKFKENCIEITWETAEKIHEHLKKKDEPSVFIKLGDKCCNMMHNKKL